MKRNFRLLFIVVVVLGVIVLALSSEARIGSPPISVQPAGSPGDSLSVDKNAGLGSGN
jgi:hypothetical protein